MAYLLADTDTEMAEDRLDAIRQRVDELRGTARETLQGAGIRRSQSEVREMGPARQDNQGDPVREKLRHIDEHKQANLVQHPSAGYAAGRTGAEQGKAEAAKEVRATEGQQKKLSPEQAKAILGEVKIQGKEAKEAEGPRKAPPEQDRKRAGRER